MNRPSPSPAMHRPTNSCVSDLALADKALPTAKMKQPSAIVYVREIRSERDAPVNEETAAVIRMEETMSPWSVGEIGAKSSSNCGMTVIGPMEPEARVNWGSKL